MQCSNRFILPFPHQQGYIPQNTSPVTIVSYIGEHDNFLNKSYLEPFNPLQDIEISTDGINFDPRYLRLFKLVNKIRFKLQHKLDDLVAHCSVPRSWATNGRLAIPRVLFLFKLPRSAASRIASDDLAIESLAQNIRLQLLGLFQNRITSDRHSGRRLFSIPGHNFVHIHLGAEFQGDAFKAQDDLAQSYMDNILRLTGQLSETATSDRNDRLKHLFPSPDEQQDPVFLDDEVSSSKRQSLGPPGHPHERSFKAFLTLHIDQMLDRLSYRHSHDDLGIPLADMPSCKGWFLASSRIYNSLFGLKHHHHVGGGRLDDHRPSLALSWNQALGDLLALTSSPDQLMIDPLHRLFNHDRVSRALLEAELEYCQGKSTTTISPLHHYVKVASAFNHFLAAANSSPSTFRSLEQLVERLTDVYLSGRVNCPAVSVNVHPCIHSQHQLPDDDVFAKLEAALSTMTVSKSPPVERDLLPQGLTLQWTKHWIESMLHSKPFIQSILTNTSTMTERGSSGEIDQASTSLPIQPHKSSLSLVSACSCGRRQAKRPDPFDCVEANYMFYAKNDKCCDTLLAIPLAPKILSKSGNMFTVVGGDDVTTSKTDRPLRDNNTRGEARSLIETDLVATEAGADSLPDLSSDSDDDDRGREANAPSPLHSLSNTTSATESESDSESNLSRGVAGPTASTSDSDSSPGPIPVRFRYGVPCHNWLPGDLPFYPSWSIMAISRYHGYSHASGLPYDGFLRGSNYLLPWDVHTEDYLVRSKHRSRSRGYNGPDTLKLFIGFEMECPRGHRFFLAGPTRAMDGPMQSGQVKGAVRSLLNQDLPLFAPCRCQTTKPDIQQAVWARLTRLYLAIPSAPIHVKLKPRVRPGPNAPLFHFGPTLDSSAASIGGSEDDVDSDDEHLQSSSRQSAGFVRLGGDHLWVLRLPYVYHDGNTAFYQPKSESEFAEWIFCRGSIKLRLCPRPGYRKR